MIKINEIIKSVIFSSILLTVDLTFYPESVKAQVVKGYVCGAETGKVYLRSQPKSSSQNANRTLANGSPVWFSQSRNGFLYVESNIGNGWITERYICYDTAPAESSSSYICGAETGKVYFRTQPKNSSQSANRTLSNGTVVDILEYRNGFALVRIGNGATGWVTERYVCP
jgi:hypothetical protein